MADGKALALIGLQRVHRDDVLTVRFGDSKARLPLAKLFSFDLGVNCGHIWREVFSDVRNIDLCDKGARFLPNIPFVHIQSSSSSKAFFIRAIKVAGSGLAFPRCLTPAAA